MREILFRGKHTDDGHWIYGMLCLPGYQADFPAIWPYCESADSELYHFGVHPETVGQYTGLKDKYGKKIFEGDILSGHFDDLFSEEESVYVVTWHENGWTIKYITKDFDSYDTADDEEHIKRHFTVIGNIHDNPELLEVSE